VIIMSFCVNDILLTDENGIVQAYFKNDFIHFFRFETY